MSTYLFGGDRCLNFKPYIYHVLSISIELRIKIKICVIYIFNLLINI